jgi:C-terminal processing protease CtpA/Prc
MFRSGFALLLAGVLLQDPAPPPPLSKFDRDASVTMLRQIKTDLKDNYYDTTFRGMNVDAVFAEAERRLATAASSVEAATILADVLLRLNDSHTVFYPPDRAIKVDYGWSAAMIGDEPFVVSVKPGSDAQKKGMAPGDRILFWNRFEPTRKSLWQIQYLYTYVRPQSMQRIIVRKPDGSDKILDVNSKVAPRHNQMSDLLDEFEAVLRTKTDRWLKSGDILIWKYSQFGDPEPANRALKMARDAKALVIDLRDNGGGSVETLQGIVTHLFDRDVLVGTEIGRKEQKPVQARGRKDAFSGPLIVVVDSRSGSAAEVLARVVQLEKRGTVVGDRTAGAVMTARMFPHTLGIQSIAFYATMITVSGLRMSDGQSLEHKGVEPDEILLPTGADLAARRDPVLARAVALLGGTMTAEQAGQLFK